MSETFPILNGMKLRETLSPLIFNFALEYFIKKVHDNQ